MQEEEKLIDIKGTLEKFIEPDEPEMTQEEAITKYKENFFKKNNAIGDNNSDSDDIMGDSEDAEHLARVKKELLDSLKRVEEIANKIYGKEKKESDKVKTKKVEKNNNRYKDLEKNEEKTEDEINQAKSKERE